MKAPLEGVRRFVFVNSKDRGTPNISRSNKVLVREEHHEGDLKNIKVCQTNCGRD